MFRSAAVREGEIKTVRNIMIVWLVSGLWHGAAWTYRRLGDVLRFLADCRAFRLREHTAGEDGWCDDVSSVLGGIWAIAVFTIGDDLLPCVVGSRLRCHVPELWRSRTAILRDVQGSRPAELRMAMLCASLCILFVVDYHIAFKPDA